MKKEYMLELQQMVSGGYDKLVMMPYCQEDMGSHGHEFFELVYITGGTAVHTLNDITGTLVAGDYFMVDYGSVHSYAGSREFTLVNCLFLPEIIDDTLHGCQSLDTLLQNCLIRYYSPTIHQTPANRVFHDADGRVWQLLRGMQEEYQEKKAGYAEIFRCRLIEILILTLRDILPAEKKHPKNTTAMDIVQYVDSNYSRPITLGMFCQERHYNLQYISRRFREETGLTFRDYLQKTRIERSCELLAGSDLRIGEVAQAVGYGDIKFFNQIFRKLLKMSPREYRRISMNM